MIRIYAHHQVLNRAAGFERVSQARVWRFVAEGAERRGETRTAREARAMALDCLRRAAAFRHRAIE